MYGVPLRIKDTKFKIIAKLIDYLKRPFHKNSAAVDSELALLLVPLQYEINGFFINPHYRQFVTPNNHTIAPYIVYATRLDALDPMIVKRMIDDAVRAEKYGLLGNAYFDARGLGYGNDFIGDFWIQKAFQQFKQQGYECFLDYSKDLFESSMPIEDVAIYMGWYHSELSGSFARPDFEFKPGSVVYHIHSSSAETLQSTSEHWVGPLLAKRGSVSIGAVDEPYLQYTPNLDIFSDRLSRGYTFAQSAYMAQPVLSLQITMVGDPLYAPFKYSLDEQIQHLEEDNDPDVEWAYIRKINLFVREGFFSIALKYCQQKIQETDSLILREKLGELYGKNRFYKEALEHYTLVSQQAVTPATSIRIGANLLFLLRLLDRNDEADKIEKDLREQWKGYLMLGWLDKARKGISNKEGKKPSRHTKTQ